MHGTSSPRPGGSGGRRGALGYVGNPFMLVLQFAAPIGADAEPFIPPDTLRVPVNSNVGRRYLFRRIVSSNERIVLPTSSAQATYCLGKRLPSFFRLNSSFEKCCLLKFF
jgi:hypothetical protein